MFKYYSEKHISSFISKRPGETKLGEKLTFVTGMQDLEKASSQFVLLGVPEDIGVRANYGNPGSSMVWKIFLKTFLNLQENQFNTGKDIILLGEVDTTDLMQKASNIDAHDPNYLFKLGDLVLQVDNVVSEWVGKILAAGKFPIIVGGGHNNAYGNIKGAAKAFGHPINVLNIDAHTDLRKREHRHSGNGFSYALHEGLLKLYSAFGIHKNYTPQYILEKMTASDNLQFNCLEDLPTENRLVQFKEQLQWIKEGKFGMELDCDAISDFPSSAVSPSGFSLQEVRLYLREAAKEKNCCYLHICEAMAADHYPTGKAISFLITDFIRERKYV